MAVQLDNVFPLGRPLKEYRLVFYLSDEDLNRKIIGVGDGIASFNYEMKLLGKMSFPLTLFTFMRGKI